MALLLVRAVMASGTAGNLMNLRATIVLIVWGVVVACGSPSEPSGAASPSSNGVPSYVPFKVATWNIRSGMGIRGFSTTNWDSNTTNCTDQSKPLNAWGMGLPQAELGRLRGDMSIVALALQEAWSCGSPTNVEQVLGFRAATGEKDGTALVARYGFSGPPIYAQINSPDWLIGGNVCLNAPCSATMLMLSTHWSGNYESQAQRVLEFLRQQPTPHILMGDFNSFKIDAWNPKVPCTVEDSPDRTQALAAIEGAGYVDAWKATQSGEGWTGMATRNGCGVPNGNLFKRIDYVYSKGLRTLATTRFARAAPGADSPSDHVGLIAELVASTPSSEK